MCRSFDVVEAQPNVEIKTQVPTTIFYVVNTVEGDGPGCTPCAFVLRMGK